MISARRRGGAAYARPRDTLDAKDVTAATLRRAAFQVLERAKAEIELDPMWVEAELERLQSERARRAASIAQ